MTVAPYVFISYARQDLAFVSRLTDDLSLNGIETWRDLEQISPGSNWQQAIDRGLAEAAAMLYVASANSTASQWIEHELTAVLARGGTVIPVVIDDVGASSMPMPLQAVQWVDFRDDYEAPLRRLLSAIPDVLKHEASLAPKSDVAKGYVFLSYAEEDAPFAKKLRTFLGNHGYAYWDYTESNRDYHTQLSAELEQVITDASATLSVLSPEWKQSKWAMKEYFFSEEAGVPVFLLRAKEVPPTLAIAGLPYIDFVRDESGGYGHLDRELSRAGL